MKPLQVQISHESVIPLHEQLNNQLRQFILSGRWPPGYRIPSEKEFQDQLQVSRSTIRQALRDIEVEGLITRVPGRGTFVVEQRGRAYADRPIAFMVIDFERPVQRRLLSGAESAARIAGYRVIFCNSNSDVSEERRLLHQLQQDRVAGILLWPSIHDDSPAYLAQLSRQAFPPVAMMDRTFHGVNWDYVASDNYSGAYTAVQHLVELGHQHIAFLSCRILDLLPVAERYRGYSTALKDAGLFHLEPWLFGEPNREIHTNYALKAYSDNDQSIVGQISEILKDNRQKVSAIFAMNDNIALLALKAASNLGIKVPDELSIVGFDDIDIVSYLPTPLTTMAQDSFAIGKRAAELLIERIEGWHSGPPRSVLIPTQLRTRASTSVMVASQSSPSVDHMT